MCCRAIWIKKAVADSLELNQSPDAIFARENWIRISEDEARSINPYHFDVFMPAGAAGLNDSAFFKCTKVTDSGCGVYEDRPDVCRGYPYTSGKPWREVAKVFVRLPPEYHPECTQWPTIPIKNI
ncbi:MAG: hypothetical protein ACRCUB_00930 [Plesiomonas shigelloides]